MWQKNSNWSRKNGRCQISDSRSYFLYRNQKAVIKYNYMDQIRSLASSKHFTTGTNDCYAQTVHRVAAAYDQIRGSGTIPGHSSN